MSRGLGRLQRAVLIALYAAHQDEVDECSLALLIGPYAAKRLIPEYDELDRKQLRSSLATLRRTFRTLEARNLAECWEQTEQHPSIEEPWSTSTATIDRLYVRITDAGVDYVESRGLDRPLKQRGTVSSSAPTRGGRRSDPVNKRYRRRWEVSDPLSTEWKRLAWNRAMSGPHRQAMLDERECELIETGLDQGRTWQELADEGGYASGTVLRQRYQRLCRERTSRSGGG